MRRAGFLLSAGAVAFSLLLLSGAWRTTAQEPPPPGASGGIPSGEEFSLNPEKEQDTEFLESLDLVGDEELLEMLVSDSDFLDVLEEFGEDIGIEEEIPLELLQEGDAFLKAEEFEGTGKMLEDIEKEQGGPK